MIAEGDKFAGNIAVIGACLKPLASLENVHPISEMVNCLTGETEVCSDQQRDTRLDDGVRGAQRTPRMDTAGLIATNEKIPEARKRLRGNELRLMGVGGL